MVKIIDVSARRNVQRRQPQGFERFFLLFISVFNDPITMAAIVIAAAGVLFHLQDKDNSTIKQIEIYMKNSTHLKKYGEWMEKNEAKTLGSLVMIPTLVNTPARYRIMTFVMVLIGMIVTAPRSLYVYIGISACINAFMKARFAMDRFIICLVLGFFYISGYLD